MDDDNNENVLFQDFLLKLKETSSGRFSRLVQERWKTKYFVLCCHQDRLLLKYYNKKPKHLHTARPKKQITLWPSFKLEKLYNTHNRAFAMELTAPSDRLCLSAEEQVTVDKFVFLLQTQFRLRDNVRDVLVEVKTEPSEAFWRIGAMSVSCFLHLSPWGLTLILKQSHALLAQWPLKSVRCYESSGQGHFAIEAGMIAPMGEGLYSFHTRSGQDNWLYNAVDHFVVSTLDRVKPHQRGTAEEINDYIREFDCLHSLTVLNPSPISANVEVTRLLRDNWSYLPRSAGTHGSSSFGLSSPDSDDISRATISESPISAEMRTFSTSSSTSSSRLVSDNSSRPLPTPRTFQMEQQNSSDILQHRSSPRQKSSPGGGARLLSRPPPTPPRNAGPSSARRVRGSSQSTRQDYMDGEILHACSSASQPHIRSNPAHVSSQLKCQTEIHLVMEKQTSVDSQACSVLQNNNLASGEQFHRSSPGSEIPLPSCQNVGLRSSPLASPSTPSDAEHGAVGDHTLDAPVEDWLISASCEDLSDHMRTFIFDDQQSQPSPETAKPTTVHKKRLKTYNSNDPEYIPPPFTDIVDFRSSIECQKSQVRDRSRSFDVTAKLYKSSHAHTVTPAGSTSPSLRQIRKMVSAKKAAKEDLHKSLSNPGFLNLGSKEKLNQHRLQTEKSNQDRRSSSAKLSSENKPKSRSLVSLLPSALRRYISRESLSHPASSSSSPEMRRSRRRSSDTRPASRDSNFSRQSSSRSLKEMSVKGIHFTEQSRSFRKPKSYQRSRSAEVTSINQTEENHTDRVERHSHPQTQAQPHMETQAGALAPNDIAECGPASDRHSSRISSISHQKEDCEVGEVWVRNPVVNGMQPLPSEFVRNFLVPSHISSQSEC